MDDDLNRWWQALTPETRSRLAADPHGFVPTDLIAEVSHAGQVVGGGYFPETSPGPEGFQLQRRVRDWIADRPDES